MDDKRREQLERKQRMLHHMVIVVEKLCDQIEAQVQADDLVRTENDWQQGFYDGRRQAFDNIRTRLEHLKNSLGVM